MNDSEYIIVGDTKEFDGCLVCACGKSKEAAEKSLQRMLNNPTDNDKAITKGHYNLRIEEVPKSTCWWNENCD